MASRALGAHRPGVVSRAATRGSSRRPFTRALFIPAPFCTCETFASERQPREGKGMNGGSDAISRQSRMAGTGKQVSFFNERKEGTTANPEAFSHSLLSVRFYDDNATFFDCLSPSAR